MGSVVGAVAGGAVGSVLGAVVTDGAGSVPAVVSVGAAAQPESNRILAKIAVSVFFTQTNSLVLFTPKVRYSYILYNLHRCAVPKYNRRSYLNCRLAYDICHYISSHNCSMNVCKCRRYRIYLQILRE